MPNQSITDADVVVLGRSRSFRPGDVVELRSSGGNGPAMTIALVRERTIATDTMQTTFSEATCMFIDKNDKVVTLSVNTDCLALLTPVGEDHVEEPPTPAPDPASTPVPASTPADTVAPDTTKKNDNKTT